MNPIRLTLWAGLVIAATRASAAESSGFSAGPLSGALFPESRSLDCQLREVPAPRRQDPSILDNRIRVALPVFRPSTDTWSVSQTVEEFNLGNSPVIQQTGEPIPRSLWSVETGGGYRHRLGDRRDWGISAGVGSASNEPFESIHETTLRVTGTYHIPSGKENSWIFLLSYSNNRHFANNVPLPGVMYIVHSPEHGLDAVIGFPFLSVNYKPAPRWSSRLSIFGPRNLSAESAYVVWEPLQVYAGFDQNQKEWLIAQRADNSQRLFFDEKKWSLGLRFPLLRKVRMDLSAGYEFNRRMYENNRAVGTGAPEVAFNPALSYQARLGVRW